MRSLRYAALAVVGALIGCTQEARQATQNATQEAPQSETLAPCEPDTDIVDSVLLPKHELKAFGDFLYLFLRNKAYQADHIRFPLPIHSADDSTTITRGADFRALFRWPSMEEYTMLVGDLSELDQLLWGEGMERVVAEVIDLDEGISQQLTFGVDSSHWQLQRVDHRPIEGTFWPFYARFVADSVFQQEALEPTLRFAEPDPDDETGQISGTIESEQWDAFRPDLPAGRLTNFIVADHSEAQVLTLVACGVASSMMRTLTFRLRQGRWRLTSFATE